MIIKHLLFSRFDIKNTSSSLFGKVVSILPNSPEITLKGNPEKVLVSWDFVVGWKGSSVGFWCVWVCVWGGVGVGVCGCVCVCHLRKQDEIGVCVCVCHLRKQDVIGNPYRSTLFFF